MPKSTLEQWRMLKAVVDHGGFAQAAAAVHKSQSTIHHAVHKLEDLLGVRLLEVEGRKARLTQAGATLLERSRHLLNQAIQIEELAGSLAAGIEPVVHLAVDAIFPYDLLYGALDQFSQRYPQTRVELFEVVLSGGEEMLRSGAADLIVSPFVPVDYMGTPVTDVDFIPVVAAHHPLARHEEPIPLTELAQHRQVVIRDSAMNQKRDAGWLGAEQRWTVTHLATSLYIVRKGLAFARLPHGLIQEELERGELVRLNLAEGGTSRITLHLVHANHETAGPATRALGELLCNQPSSARPALSNDS